jgi:hypothetical protein
MLAAQPLGDEEIALDDDCFELDEQEIEKVSIPLGNKLLKKSTQKKKQVVGQSTPQLTIKTPIKICSSPLRNKGQSAHMTESPIFDIVDETPPEGPANIKQAQLHKTWPFWKAAMEKEVAGLLKRGTWVAVQ